MSKQLTNYVTRAQKFSLSGLFLLSLLTSGFLYSIPTFLIFNEGSPSYYLYPLCLLFMSVGLTVKNLLYPSTTKITLVMGLIFQAVFMYLCSILIQFLIVTSLAIGFNYSVIMELIDQSGVQQTVINKVSASAMAAGVIIWATIAEWSVNHRNKSLQIYEDVNSGKPINSELSDFLCKLSFWQLFMGLAGCLLFRLPTKLRNNVGLSQPLINNSSDKYENLKDSVKSKPFIKLFLLAFLTNIFPQLMWNSLKFQGQTYFTESSDLLMTVTYSLGALSAITPKFVPPPLWAHQTLIVIQLFICSLWNSLAVFPFFLILLFALQTFVSSALFQLLPSLLSQSFSHMKHRLSDMYTIISIAYPLSALIGSLLMDAILPSVGLSTVLSLCGAATSIGFALTLSKQN